MAQDKDVKQLLVACLKELHLPAFRSRYEELARQAQQEGLSYEQYLLGLTEQECQQRRGQRKNVRLAPEPVTHGCDHFPDRQRLRIRDNESSPQRSWCCQHCLDRRRQIFQREQRAARPEAAERQWKG